MTKIFDILRELFQPSPEDLRLARERNIRHVLWAILALKKEGNMFPTLEDISGKLIRHGNAMPPALLSEYCGEAKAHGYVQFLWGPRKPCLTLSDNGYNHLGLPA